MLPRATAVLLLIAACRQKAPPIPPPRSCLDVQLAQRGLNEFGDPPGTLYAGGTPLFDERTGKSMSREDYLRAKHPELAQACR